MSVQTQIDRIKDNITSAFNAVGNKGGTVPTSKNSDNLETAINSIPTDVTLPELKDPGTAEDLVWGKEMIDGDGNVVTGKFDLLPTEFAENSFLYAKNVGVREANGSKRIYFTTPSAGRIGYEAEAPIQMEAVARLFGDAKPEDVIDGATFTSEEGLEVPGTIPFIPAGQRASIGLADEAYRTEHAAYPVVRATAPIRVRLAMDAESSAQIDIPFWVLPDAEANLLAENIKKGVSIFGVVGSYEGGGNFAVTEATLASSYGTKTGKVLCTIPYIGEHINDPGLFVMLMRKDTTELVLSVPIVMACNSAYLNSSYSIAVQRTQYGVSVAYKPNEANGYQLNNSSAKDMPRVYADASGNVYILPYGSYTFEAGTYSVIYGIL